MDIASYLIGSKLGGGGGGGGGGASVESKDVDFIDYDGTIVYSYSKADFLALSAMPDNPSHDRLVAQGWNWTLADAKAYVAECGGLVIGQEYVTASGKTEIDVQLTEATLSFYLRLYLNGSATVDWGDGSATDTMTGSNALVAKQHTYSAAGKYTITIDGVCTIYGGNYPVASSYLLSSSSDSSINDTDVKFLSIITAIRCASNAVVSWYGCARMTNLEYITLPSDTRYRTYVFSNCTRLCCVIIPSAATISSPSYVFSYCYSLKAVSLPKSITLGASDFIYTTLKKLRIPSGTSTIPASILQFCKPIKEITIPATVTSIHGSAFPNTDSLYVFKFVSTTPPTVSGSGAFGKTTGLVLLVPAGTAATYKGTTNYPSDQTNTYIEY